jgi:hypothetical protein
MLGVCGGMVKLSSSFVYMVFSVSRTLGTALAVGSLFVTGTLAAGMHLLEAELLDRALTVGLVDCKTATVGSPYSTWYVRSNTFAFSHLMVLISYDIYTAAKITAAQFSSYNPGLNCAAIQIGKFTHHSIVFQ